MKKDILDEAHKEAEEIVKGANKQVENTIRTIKESQAEKEKTQEARMELQNFVSALSMRKVQEQKDHDDHLEEKLKQLEARNHRQQSRNQQKMDAREGRGRQAGRGAKKGTRGQQLHT